MWIRQATVDLLEQTSVELIANVTDERVSWDNKIAKMDSNKYQYSNEEYLSMVQLYAIAEFDANEARSLYAESKHITSLKRKGILDPQIPSAETIVDATQRLLDYGQFKTPEEEYRRGPSPVRERPRRLKRAAAEKSLSEHTVNGDHSDAHQSTFSHSSKEGSPSKDVSTEDSPKKDKKKKKGLRTPSFLKKKKEKKKSSTPQPA